MSDPIVKQIQAHPQGMMIAKNLYPMTDDEILAATLFGEARGEGVAGVLAVLAVIEARAAHPNPNRFGDCIRRVCLRPYQFSVWLDPHTTINNFIRADGEAAALEGNAPTYLEADKDLATAPGNHKFANDAEAIIFCRAVATRHLMGLQLGEPHEKIINKGWGNHYHTDAILPSWAAGAKSINRTGAHIFYELD